VQEVIEDQSDGSTKQKELATSTIRNYPTPLPPLAEQKRIVARVEELLAVIDG
jgi:type I restriction enzyme S subunit